jgi:hypothetical protein
MQVPSGQDGGKATLGTMSLTPSHYIAVGQSWTGHIMIPARQLRVGMQILHANKVDR